MTVTARIGVCACAMVLGLGCGDDDGGDDTAGGDAGRDAATPAGEDAAAEHDAALPSDVDDASSDAAADADAGTAEPSTGTFPAVEDPWEEGPFSPMTVENTGPDGAYTLVRPAELAPDGAKNPIVVWGNGGGTTPSFYATTLPHRASHGFVVIAANSSMVSGALLEDGLDWILEQNEDPASDLYDKLDIDHVGAMGYSLGSLAIYEIIDDPRLVTTVHASGGIRGDDDRSAVLHEPGPTAYFCDGMDTKDNCDGDYEVVEVPVFYGTLLGAQHVTVFLTPYVERVNGAATAWLRWYLMGDETQAAVFLGDDCTLCEDPNWTVQRKNWD